MLLLCLAVSLPLFGTLRTVAGLDGKRIVANRSGQLDWDVPQHDRYGRDTAGMYGMLPALVGSLGGELSISSELSRADLESADALIMLHPDTSLSLEQQDRIWQYVREGGSLLVVTEGFLPENGLERRVNELLQPTSISVNRDAAVSETKDWWGSIRTLEHPATTVGVSPGDATLLRSRSVNRGSLAGSAIGRRDLGVECAGTGSHVDRQSELSARCEAR